MLEVSQIDSGVPQIEQESSQIWLGMSQNNYYMVKDPKKMVIGVSANPRSLLQVAQMLNYMIIGVLRQPEPGFNHH